MTTGRVLVGRNPMSCTVRKVRLRWGDKVVSEIIKVSMTEYVDAIHEVLDRRSKTQRGQDSEDPAAEAEF
jgi:hypothetical protein